MLVATILRMIAQMLDDDPYARWSMIGSLVSAGATVMGVILAGVGGIVAYRLYKVETERDLRIAEEALRQQAAMIAFWVRGGQVFVGNHSPLPIYNVMVARPHLIDAKPRTPIQNFRVMVDGQRVNGLLPGMIGTVELDVKATAQATGAEVLLAAGPNLVLLFRDNAGVRWLRTIEGRLIIDDSPEPDRDLKMILT
jgi:hypothetical protein